MEKISKEKIKERGTKILNYVKKLAKTIGFTLLSILAIVIICLVTNMIAFYAGSDINNYYQTFRNMIHIGLFLNFILHLSELEKRKKEK